MLSVIEARTWNLLIRDTAYSLLGIQHTAYWTCEAAGVTFGLYFNHIAHPGALWDLLGLQHTIC